MVELLKIMKPNWLVNEKTIYIPAGHERCCTGKALGEEKISFCCVKQRLHLEKMQGEVFQ